MNVLYSLLKADLYRALLSLNFILSIIFIMFVMLISCFGFITNTSDAISLLGHALTGSGSALFILCIAPILPYGMSFAADLEDKAVPFWVIRTGKTDYAISKFISSAIAGFLSVGTGIVVFVLVLSSFFPLFNSISAGDSYAVLLEYNKPVMYVFAIAAHYSLSAVLFAGGAIAVSALIPNKLTVMAAPIVIYFVLMRLTDLAPIPMFLKASFLVQGIYPGVDPLTAFLYKLIPVVGISGILLTLTIRQIKKRLEMS